MNTTLIFIFIVVLIGLGLLIFLIISRQKNSNAIDRAEYRKQWLSITGNVTESPAAMKMAIMEADALLDRGMRQLGIKGDTMGERLKSADNMIRRKNEVWAAHKLRNRLAHEPGTKISSREVELALRGIRAGLEDLKIL